MNAGECIRQFWIHSGDTRCRVRIIYSSTSARSLRHFLASSRCQRPFSPAFNRTRMGYGPESVSLNSKMSNFVNLGMDRRISGAEAKIGSLEKRTCKNAQEISKETTRSMNCHFTAACSPQKRARVTGLGRVFRQSSQASRVWYAEYPCALPAF